MYHMKSIVDHREEINLSKCMYSIKNPNESLKDEIDEVHTKICNQLPNTKMTELEQRQEVLIKKLDILYDRIKTISAYCNQNNGKVNKVKGEKQICSVPTPEEVVLVVNPDNLPWYLYKIIQEHSAIFNLSWHIHSSVPNEKVQKIKDFVKGLKVAESQSKINLRLIFKSVSADSELKLSSLAIPIIGTVNILRYLSYAYPNAIPYDGEDFEMDSLLDICHVMEKTPDKSRETLIKKLFSGCKDWIYKNKYSVVDLAAYNVIKQSKGSIKHTPKAWFDQCELMCT